MLKQVLKFSTVLSLAIALGSCNKDEPTPSLSSGLDKLVIGTNITTANQIIGYVGTLKDLSVGNFTNSKSRQSTEYPYVTIYKNDVFVRQAKMF